MDKVHIIMAEFGEKRNNNGGGSKALTGRFEPSLSSINNIFPDSHKTMYTNIHKTGEDCELSKFDNIISVDEQQYAWANHFKSGNRLSDYFKIKGALESLTSGANFAIAIDSDMVFYEKFKLCVKLVKKFDILLPINPRGLVINDCYGVSNDGILLNDEPEEFKWSTSYNCSPMVFNNSVTSINFLREVLQEFEKTPARLPLVLSRAAFKTATSPYALSRHWCVCAGDVDVDKFKPPSSPLVLHVGHEVVAKHYGVI